MPPLFSFPIESKSSLCDAVRAYGLLDFASLCEYVRALPYGRVASSNNPLLVLREGKGTCSSKHQLLATVAHDCGHHDVQLTVGIYEMSEANTPGVGAVLQRASISSIPEAHCYLMVGQERFDFTGLPIGNESPFMSLLEEHVVPPQMLGKSKTGLHIQALEVWASGAGVSIDKAWSAREACIAALAANHSIEGTHYGTPHVKRSPYGEINSCSLKTESSSMHQ